MRHFILALLVSMVLFTSGCAFTDRYLLTQKEQDGKPVYIDNITKAETFAPVDATGKDNEPAPTAVPSSAFTGLASILKTFPGWGDAAFYGVVSLAALYGAWRTKKLVIDSKARTAAIKAGMVLVNAVVADWKAGVLDADRDGTVSLAEIADYIKMKAIKSLTPEGIQAILKVISDAVMPEAAKSAELEKIAADL